MKAILDLIKTFIESEAPEKIIAYASVIMEQTISLFRQLISILG